MSQARFTEAAEPSVEAAAATAVGRITTATATIRGADAVLLGGSLGRGEGTPSPDGGLASDIEVYLVGPHASLRTDAARLESRLRRDRLTASASVAWLDPERLRRGWAKNLSRRSSRTIQLYELGAGTMLLAGTRPAMVEIDPAKLPLAEGIRLILNRFAEATPLVVAGSSDASRWLDKVLIACGDTLLLSAGAYTVSYRERSRRLAGVEAAWPLPDGWRDAVPAAYERKLRGGSGGDPLQRIAALAGATLRGAVGLALGIRIGTWESFPDAFVPAAARDETFLRYLPPIGPAAHYEAFVVLARARRSGRRLSPRALVSALRGRPLSLAMQAAAVPLFMGIAEDRPELLSAAARSMRDAGIPPLVLRSVAQAPADLAALLRRYWEAVA